MMLIVLLACFVIASQPFQIRSRRRYAPSRYQPPNDIDSCLRDSSRCRSRVGTSLSMALTPVGPFCPFRSTAALSMEEKMERLSSKTPEFATEMTRIQLDFSMGQIPDADRLVRVADGLEREVENWEELVTRLRISSDFQTREYAKLTQAHLDQFNSTVESISAMVLWQAACMRAMANNSPPPMPPPEVNLTMIMEQQQQHPSPPSSDVSSQRPSPPSISAMALAEKITAPPFDEELAFGSTTVKEEYLGLCRDHMNLIEFGGKYGSFDPTGKLMYLDEVEKIQDRWDVFFARFQLMGALNPKYTRQCSDFLASMSMDEAKYRDLLKRCHDLMRTEAERERNLSYSN